jgi:small basic protein
MFWTGCNKSTTERHCNIPKGFTPVAYVSVQVLASLKALYGALYTEQNVMLSASHTHSTPGGFMQNLLFDLSVLGFVRQTFVTLLTGIVIVSCILYHKKTWITMEILTSSEWKGSREKNVIFFCFIIISKTACLRSFCQIYLLLTRFFQFLSPRALTSLQHFLWACKMIRHSMCLFSSPYLVRKVVVN